MTACPQCGGRIEATVPVYLENVELDDEGRVVGFGLAFTWDKEWGGAFAWDTGDVRLYCENDHAIEYVGVDTAKTPQLQLLGPMPTPPAELADAWRRFQEGGEVTPAELRELDEWRTDVAWEGMGW